MKVRLISDFIEEQICLSADVKGSLGERQRLAVVLVIR